jgi:NTE family protein
MVEQAKLNTIKRLVFSGGGARGVVYSGAYAAMEETGVFQDIEAIAGSSAGAITASLLAVGLPPKEFQATLRTTDFSKLLGEKSKGAYITKDAELLYRFLQENINKPIISFLEKQKILDKTCQTILDKLTNNQQTSITFGELHTLREHYSEQKQFKDLTVTATKEEDGSLTFFNHKTAPDVEIALACKASGAIPVVLEPVTIKGIKYVDGGISDNIPASAFEQNNAKKSETLLFAFVEGNPTEKNKTWSQRIWTFIFCNQAVWNALYGSRPDPDEPKSKLFNPPIWEAVWRNYMSKWLSSLKTDYTITDKKDEGFQRIRDDYTLRTVGLGVNDLLSAKFVQATRTARFMSVRGYLDTMDMVFNHDLHHVEIGKTQDQYPNEFYAEVVMNFVCIYKATLCASGKDPSRDAFLKQISSDKRSLLSTYYLIRDTAQGASTSNEAFALTRAVEYRKGELTHDALEREIKAKCRVNKSPWFSLFHKKQPKPEINLDLDLDALSIHQQTTPGRTPGDI